MRGVRLHRHGDGRPVLILMGCFRWKGAEGARKKRSPDPDCFRPSSMLQHLPGTARMAAHKRRPTREKAHALKNNEGPVQLAVRKIFQRLTC